MKLINKIDYIIKNTDYAVRHDGQEIVDIDLETNEVFSLHGDTTNLDNLNESDFDVYSFKQIPSFPNDIFKLTKMFKKILKNAETPKEEMFIVNDEEHLFSKDSIRRLTEVGTFIEEINDFEFYNINIKKDYLKKNKNFK